jgi:tetratricopeptide (TPR) repeat protein
MLSTVDQRTGWRKLIDAVQQPWASAAIVAVVALVIRFTYLAQARQAPDFDVLFSDQNSYDVWAQHIAAGDWLSRYQGIFFQSPLYSYFLGAFYALFGRNLLAVRVVQLLLGSSACVMLYFATRRLFGSWAGLIAGLMLGIYPSAILFDLQIDKSVLDTLLLAGLMLLLAHLQAHASRTWRWLVTGLVLGLWSLNRENALLLLPILILWCWLAFRQISRRERLIRIAAMSVGTLGLLTISAARNYFIGGEWHLTTAQFGYNFWVGNARGADGLYRALRDSHADPIFERHDAIAAAEQAVGHKLTPGGASNYLTRRTLGEIGDAPAEWLRLTSRKLLLVWNRAEIADSADLDYFIVWSSLLRCLERVFNFPTLFALFAFGVALTWQYRRRLIFLYALILIFALSVAVFYIFARYRYPLVLMIIPIASGGLIAFWPAIRERQWRTLISGATLGAVAMTISLPAIILPERIRGVDYYNRGVAFAARGDVSSALTEYHRSLRANPNSAQARNNLGLLLSQQGDSAGAVHELDEAVRLAPQRADLHNNRATVLIAAKRPDDAEADLREAVRLNPNFISAWFNLGLLAGQRGELDEAVEAFSQVVRMQGVYPDARFRLGQALASVHRDREAVEQFRLALQLDPDSLRAADTLAMLLATSKDPAVRNPVEAQHIAETANRITQGQSPALLDTLSITYAEQGRFDEAIQTATRARQLADSSGQTKLGEQIAKRLADFQARRAKQ